MLNRKALVLATCAIFSLTMCGLGIWRAVTAPKPLFITAKEYPSIGPDDAKVEVVVFEDFLCHTCRYFSIEVFPAIESTYIAPGTVKYVMIPLAFSTRSKEIASAALAVYAQAPTFYFPFIRELFLRFSDSKLDLPDLLELVSKFDGIDLASFEASVKSGLFDPQLEKNFHVARKAMGKNLRTPAVFINGFPLPGISFESISVQIESILQSTGAE